MKTASAAGTREVFNDWLPASTSDLESALYAYQQPSLLSEKMLTFSASSPSTHTSSPALRFSLGLLK